MDMRAGPEEARDQTYEMMAMICMGSSLQTSNDANTGTWSDGSSQSRRSVSIR